MATPVGDAKKRKRKAESNTVAAPRSAFEIAKARRLATSRPQTESHSQHVQLEVVSGDDAPQSQVQVVEEIVLAATITDEFARLPTATPIDGEQPAATEDNLLLGDNEQQQLSEQSNVSSGYNSHDEDLLEHPIQRSSDDYSSARATQQGYTTLDPSHTFARTVEISIDRDHPLLIDRPCRMTTTVGVVRCFGAQFDRKSGSITMYPMMTHYRVPIETNEEAVVQIDFTGFDDDPGAQQRLTYFSEYNLLRAGADSIPVLRFPSSWTEARRQYLLERISRDSRARCLHVCGRHARNRSLFFKFMLNSLFSQGLASQTRMAKEVYVIDLDAENPEFTPAGQISLIKVTRPLIGPAYMNHAYGRTAFEVLRAHAISPAGHRSYQKAFRAMITDLRSIVDGVWYDCHMRNIPKPVLMIRHGHYKEPLFNSDLLDIINGQDQSSMIYLVDNIESHDMGDVHSLTELSHEIVPLRSLAESDEEDELKSIHLSTRHLRHLQQMSYFHHEINSNSGLVLWNNTPLSSRRVCELSYKTVEQDFAAVLTLFGQRPLMHMNFLSELINGMLISIVVLDKVDALSDRAVDRSEGDGIPYFTSQDEMGAQPLGPTVSHVVGVGLVRGVDIGSQIIELIVPDHVSTGLSEVPSQRIVLVAGCIEVPSWPQAEYLSWAKENRDRPHFVDTPAPWTTALPSLSRRSEAPRMMLVDTDIP